MDETDDIGMTPVGEQLRAAREAKGMDLEDVASQTRIPRRHLESIELGEWSRLPAPTYTLGFAKSYATVVGLDRVAIGDQLRAEMGGTRAAPAAAELFEPSDPARTMPKWLVFGAIAAILALVLVMSWLSNRSLEDDAAPAEEAPVAAAEPGPAVAPSPAPAAAGGPVVITANEQVWIQVKDGGSVIKAGLLEAGQSFEVPATAKAPMLTTGKPEALRIAVGTADAPSVGPPATTVTNVSLLGADLMRGPAAAAPPTATPPAQ
ncbi:helix-turn-helix domain-containing protein [Sphingomonas sp.]|uniref:helix-turn-helix domain-containing protein n=1 Tax=Sphingomonas sp. TaxID=28214 RepID=UPI00286E68F3|nr:helix-turn-helix domain-containing protein [Sphingomonas sp.]